jgi:excisionase family DNA binding protein
MALADNVTNRLERKAFSLREVAEMYGVSLQFLRLEVARGRLRPLRLGRRVLIAREALEEWAGAGSGNSAMTSARSSENMARQAP